MKLFITIFLLLGTLNFISLAQTWPKDWDKDGNNSKIYVLKDSVASVVQVRGSNRDSVERVAIVKAKNRLAEFLEVKEVDSFAKVELVKFFYNPDNGAYRCCAILKAKQSNKK